MYLQSMAIARYAGRLGGFYPSDAIAALQVDEIMHTLDEVFELIVDIVMYTSDAQAKVEKARKLEIRLDMVFAFFESMIQGDFLLGETLSLADLHIFCTSQSVQVVLPSYSFASFPKITATITSVKAVPKIAAYLARRT
ncbi:hypothetical protein Poli38472_010147 [Pythium oligandrum]|uniref:GST C-terminal domain-containing protein n=1 Tax=Pythium oligandrum TaxID=41045 RepID=A0A8K1FHA7_PYTOL|nr:hypothetical protein Poli38472_010147 [Pythium oligandrum]|eukprot:TMW58588.1 hypothetical protein Poli38472_010147 [Pythium oligandrum]